MQRVTRFLPDGLREPDKAIGTSMPHRKFVMVLCIGGLSHLISFHLKGAKHVGV